MFSWIVAIVAIVFVCLFIATYLAQTPEQKVKAGLFAPPKRINDKVALDAKIICSQCQTRGSVSTRAITAKVGISGGKATGALLTGGLSLLATGLSRKQAMTEAKCSNCGATWRF